MQGHSLMQQIAGKHTSCRPCRICFIKNRFALQRRWVSCKPDFQHHGQLLLIPQHWDCVSDYVCCFNFTVHVKASKVKVYDMEIRFQSSQQTGIESSTLLMLYIIYCTGWLIWTVVQPGLVDDRGEVLITEKTNALLMVSPSWESKESLFNHGNNATSLRAAASIWMVPYEHYRPTHLLSISLLLWASSAHWSLPTLIAAVPVCVLCWMFHHIPF